ncbi:hypothetical protein [Stagnihabitans tardus]|uniref:Uncharacterized protein n=1 Tax=Stagnihabitans tardus TaxID=2699202 RepID=A0AAE5BWU5_9RHOB|nr:hypothetical protein [Stagnihabitans tardus]NBZ89677.1 hypothetical protein [Stagnihabitans tardus]
MDRLLFGDNQFFGVNHMSEDKARAQMMRFRDTGAIMEVLDQAYDAGIRTFMCTTHERIREVADVVRANPARYPDFLFYPCMPYAHKYANAMTDLGLVGAISSFLPEGGKMAAMLSGGMALAQKDAGSIARLLIDAEMKMFAGLKTPVIFLQNVFTDLMLGLGFTGAFRIFHDHVREKYGAEPGYITMNLPALYKALSEEGIENPVICANINKIGFRMCGGHQAYLDVLQNGRLQAVAMSVYASGAIPAEEAISWVTALPNLKSIVFGASSRGNILSTRDLVAQHWKHP